MPITFRSGTADDSPAAFGVLRLAIHGLLEDLHMATPAEKPGPQQIAALFVPFRPFAEHIVRTGEHFWVAEDAGEVIGFARSLVRDGVRQLSEFFVLPDRQVQGLGKRLLDLAFPVEGVNNRVIIASPDVRAISRYLKTGVRSRFTIYEWSRQPEIVPFETDLAIEPISATPAILAELDAIDRLIIGYTRAVDHAWLSRTRRGHLYRRSGQTVGYSYLGNRAGPIGMLHNHDFPAVLAHVESEMTKYVDEVFRDIVLAVPMTNLAALDYVLKRSYRTNPFMMHFLSAAPLGQYDNYVFMDPPLIT